MIIRTASGSELQTRKERGGVWLNINNGGPFGFAGVVLTPRQAEKLAKELLRAVSTSSAERGRTR